MKNKISKKLLVIFTSIMAISAAITGIAFACAGGDDFEDFYNSFFAPETSHADDSAPFYRSIHTFYNSDNYGDAVHDMDSTNIQEWQSFFGGKSNAADLNYIIYQLRIGEIDSCIFFLKNSAYPIKSQLKKNSLLAFDDKALLKEFLFYQGFAKRCEPYSTYVQEWWSDDDTNDPRKDTEAMNKLVNGGKKAVVNAKSPFIKERYAFQIIRLLYQVGTYDECVSFYIDNKQLFTSGNTMQYRTMGYVAGAYYKLERYSDANYLYSLIFDHCEPMKQASFLSFHPQDEEDWQQAIHMARNTREKEVLWHLLGIYADPVRAMQEIYKLNPKSELMDLLVARAVNINEESFIRYQDYWEDSKDSGYSLKSTNVDQELLNFVQKLAAAGNTNKPYLWNLTAGYLNLAQGNYKLSEKYFSKAENASKGDKLVNEQIHIFRIMNKVEEYKKPDTKYEDELSKELTWLGEAKYEASLRGGYVYSWALSRLSEKYKSWGDSVKAQCLDYRQNKYFYYNPVNMESLIHYMDKPHKTAFDNLILSVHPYSKGELFSYKAIKLIYQYKFKEALTTLDSCKDAGSGGLQADPFIIHINDCHDCDFVSQEGDAYDQRSFVEKLLELQGKATSDPKNAAQNYFLLANGLYNMTYFGNAHDVFGSPLIDLSVGYFSFDYDAIEPYYPYFDCSKAMEYYQKAMDASTNKEFKAKCCFMAAKCEQNLYYASGQFSYDKAIKTGVYFRELVKTYPKTKYYQEILKECGYFRTYTGMK